MTDVIENRDTVDERPGGRRNLALIIAVIGLLFLFGGSLIRSLFTSPPPPETPAQTNVNTPLSNTARNLLSGEQLFDDPAPPPVPEITTLEDTLTDPLFTLDTPFGVTLAPGDGDQNQAMRDALSAPIDGNVSVMILAQTETRPNSVPGPFTDPGPELPSQPDLDTSSSSFLQALADIDIESFNPTAGGPTPEADAPALDQPGPSYYHDPQRTLLPGAVIPVMLTSEINSDFATTWIGHVTHSVFDASIRHVLIPPGSTITGHVVAYSGANAIIRNRVALVADTLTRPDGQILTLALPALDAAGAGGVAGDTQSHFLARTLGTVAFAIFSIGPALAVDNGQPQSSRDEATSRVVEQTGQSFQPLAQQYASIVPTTIIPPGTRLRLLVDFPLAIEPWPDARPIVNFGGIGR